jgi:hypothetical protein
MQSPLMELHFRVRVKDAWWRDMAIAMAPHLAKQHKILTAC